MSIKEATRELLYVTWPAIPFATCNVVVSQIRIDAEGTQEYIQFEAQPHPNMRPMAYQANGLANLVM